LRLAPEQKQPNKDILAHEEKKKLEVKVYEWAQKEGLLDTLPEEELEQILAKKRAEIKLEAEKEAAQLEKKKIQQS
jgi:hypothetical protein